MLTAPRTCSKLPQALRSSQELFRAARNSFKLPGVLWCSPELLRVIWSLKDSQKRCRALR
eukprot:257502-Alexandrium_andersonii.AAC.1